MLHTPIRTRTAPWVNKTSVKAFSSLNFKTLKFSIIGNDWWVMRQKGVVSCQVKPSTVIHDEPLNPLIRAYKARRANPKCSTWPGLLYPTITGAAQTQSHWFKQNWPRIILIQWLTASISIKLHKRENGRITIMSLTKAFPSKATSVNWLSPTLHQAIMNVITPSPDGVAD